MGIDYALLQKAANEARGLAMDAVHACQSGHLGLPLGAAEIGAILFGHALRFDPRHPRWLNRDLFVLSAGHGSMFLYGWLHLAGYDLPLAQLKKFRALHSLTPGHPEFRETPGVECTTGPLGQGVGNAVGLAMAAKMAAALFNTPEHTLFDQHVYCLAGDGCLQEGVAREAVALAGHLGLNNLVLIYDSNDVTLDAMADKTQSENTEDLYRALGWEVQTIDGHNFGQIGESLHRARNSTTDRPQLIIAKTLIGKGIAEVQGTQKAHGEGGAKFIGAARKALSLPEDQHFFVSDEVRAYFAKRAAARAESHAEWEQVFAAWREANPAKAAVLDNALAGTVPDNLLDLIPAFPADAKIATRKAGQDVLQPLAKALPTLLSGSADLHGSTLNYIAGGGDYGRHNPAGRNFYFGIREHAMGAIVNGFGYYGLFRPSGATFLTFSDYLRPSIRLAALSKLPIFHIFTHDSVGVGEDGPTHQPVETYSSLRLIPNLDVIRPGDPEETAGAFVAALERTDGPTALILSRQALPMQNGVPVETRRRGALRGGYVAKMETAALEFILLATGTELQHAMAAAAVLGAGARVVSLPCFERFDRQPESYREEVLPSSCRKRVAIEAGVPDLWYRYVGLDGKVVGIRRFGLSAPGNVVMKELGITADAVVAAARAL